jgi:hypothetical protein
MDRVISIGLAATASREDQQFWSRVAAYRRRPDQLPRLLRSPWTVLLATADRPPPTTNVISFPQRLGARAIDRAA